MSPRSDHGHPDRARCLWWLTAMKAARHAGQILRLHFVLWDYLGTLRLTRVTAGECSGRRTGERAMAGTTSRSLGMPGVSEFGGGLLVELLKTHPKVLLGGLVFENGQYLSPDEYRSGKS